MSRHVKTPTQFWLSILQPNWQLPTTTVDDERIRIVFNKNPEALCRPLRLNIHCGARIMNWEQPLKNKQQTLTKRNMIYWESHISGKIRSWAQTPSPSRSSCAFSNCCVRSWIGQTEISEQMATVATWGNPSEGQFFLAEEHIKLPGEIVVCFLRQGTSGHYVFHCSPPQNIDFEPGLDLFLPKSQVSPVGN